MRSIECSSFGPVFAIRIRARKRGARVYRLRLSFSITGAVLHLAELPSWKLWRFQVTLQLLTGWLGASHLRCHQDRHDGDGSDGSHEIECSLAAVEFGTGTSIA